MSGRWLSYRLTFTACIFPGGAYFIPLANPKESIREQRQAVEQLWLGKME
jgi:hypothetical protein